MLRQTVADRASRHFKGRLIDIGCGTKRYAPVLAGIVTEHVGVDHAASPVGSAGPDIIASAYEIPVPDGSFDSALMTEVLEHLEDPVAALRECRRVLRPGGRVLITVPFIWHLHEEPRDFFRYSGYGLEAIAAQADLEVLETAPLGGYWITVGQLTVYALFMGGGWSRIPRSALARFVQWAAPRLERRWPRPSWPSHFVAVMRRPT